MIEDRPLDGERRKNMPSRAMILAAGRGSRLGSITERRPKCMLSVGGKTILEQAIENLRRHGIRNIVINLALLPGAVMDYLGNGGKWGVRISYCVEPRMLGTAGGVKNAEWFFDGPFLVWYGDNLSTCDLSRLCSFHREKGGVATIALFHREDVEASGIVGLDAEDRITRFLEKPGPDRVFSHWVNAGIYVLEPEVLDAIPPTGASDFGKDIFPALLARNDRLYGYRMSESEGLWWVDTPDDLRRVEEQYRRGLFQRS